MNKLSYLVYTASKNSSKVAFNNYNQFDVFAIFINKSYYFIILLLYTLYCTCICMLNVFMINFVFNKFIFKIDHKILLK